MTYLQSLNLILRIQIVFVPQSPQSVTDWALFRSSCVSNMDRNGAIPVPVATNTICLVGSLVDKKILPDL